jgi:hypothetical protein
MDTQIKESLVEGNRNQISDARTELTVAVLGQDTPGMRYAALVTACGHSVISVGSDEKQVSLVRAGLKSLGEPKIEQALSRAQFERRLTFSADLDHVILRADVIILTMLDGKAASAIKENLKEIGKALKARSSFVTLIMGLDLPTCISIGQIKSVLEEKSGKKCGLGFGLGLINNMSWSGREPFEYSGHKPTDIGVTDQTTTFIAKQLFKNKIHRLNIVSLREAELLQRGTDLWQMMRGAFISEFARFGHSRDGDSKVTMKVLDTLMQRYSGNVDNYTPPIRNGSETNHTRIIDYLRDNGGDTESFPYLNALARVTQAEIMGALSYIEALDGNKVGFLGLRDRAGDRPLSTSPYLTLMLLLQDAGTETGYCDFGLTDDHIKGADMNVAPIPGLTKIDLGNRLTTSRFSHTHGLIEDHDVILLCSYSEPYIRAAKRSAASKPVIDLCGGMIGSDCGNVTVMPFN